MDPTTLQTDFWLGLGTNVLAAALGLGVGLVFRDLLVNRRRFGGWHVKLYAGGEQKVDREISWRKAKEIAEEPSDLSVFLKGVASPYAWITCDLIADGERLGLVTVEKESKWLFGETRTYIIDVDKNPKPDKSRFQNWQVRVIEGQMERVKRPINPARAERILDDPDELAALVLQLAAPFGEIHCDPVSQGYELGILVVDEEARIVTINLDRNPAQGEAT